MRPVNFGQRTGAKLHRIANGLQSESRGGQTTQLPQTLFVCRLLEQLRRSEIGADDNFYSGGLVARFDEVSHLDDEALSEQLDLYLSENEVGISGTPTSARALMAVFNFETLTFGYTGLIRVWNMWPIDFYTDDEIPPSNVVSGPSNLEGDVSGNIGRGWLAIEKGPGGLWWAANPRRHALLVEGNGSNVVAVDLV